MALPEQKRSASSDPRQSVKAIASDLQQASSRLHLSLYTLFPHALDLWAAALHIEDYERWQEASRGLEEALPLLVHALALLLQEAERNYVDLLGLVYMNLGQYDKKFAQYFTPPTIAAFIAEAMLDGGEPPRRFIDPACGSGVMLLAYAAAVARSAPEMLEHNEIEFTGLDIDEICVSMTRLNLQLHGLTIPRRKPNGKKIIETLQAILADS